MRGLPDLRLILGRPREAGFIEGAHALSTSLSKTNSSLVITQFLSTDY